MGVNAVGSPGITHAATDLLPSAVVTFKPNPNRKCLKNTSQK